MARRNRTLTFQPEPDVAELLERFTRENVEFGVLTRTINAAIRQHLASSLITVLEEDLAVLQTRINKAKKLP